MRLRSLLLWVGCGLITVCCVSADNSSPFPLAHAADPVSQATAVISAPSVARMGDLVVLDARASTAESYSWRLIVSPRPAPDLPAPTIAPVEEGQRCFFASGTPGTYHFILAVAQDSQVDQVVHEVLIQGPLPNPPLPTPEPDNPAPPDPSPEPDLPPGKYGLAKLARDLAQEIDPSARTEGAKSLAGSFRSISAAIAAGTLSGAKTILDATRVANREALSDALGDRSEAWVGWSAQLAERLQELYQSGELASTSDFQTAWEEIAIGLESLGK